MSKLAESKLVMDKLQKYLDSHETSEMHASDIAKILKKLDDSLFADAIPLIPKDIIGDVALALPDRYFDDVVRSLNADELRHAITQLESDDQAEFMQELEELDKQIAAEVFSTLHEDDKKRF